MLSTPSWLVCRLGFDAGLAFPCELVPFDRRRRVSGVTWLLSLKWNGAKNHTHDRRGPKKSTLPRFLIQPRHENGRAFLESPLNVNADNGRVKKKMSKKAKSFQRRRRRIRLREFFGESCAVDRSFGIGSSRHVPGFHQIASFRVLISPALRKTVAELFHEFSDPRPPACTRERPAEILPIPAARANFSSTNGPRTSF